MTDPKLRDALAERLAEITNNYTIYSTDGLITVDYRAIASRLLESVPGEEEMASWLRANVYWPGENTKTARDGFFLACARFLRSKIAGWMG